jgi:hypothetical protein
MARVTKYQVDRAAKKAARAKLQQHYDGLKAKLSKVPLSDAAKREDLKYQMKVAQYEKDRIRVRRKNGNGKKKSGGLF